ncbi:RagB/SusD family nutrient uptake outer membrane protein [Pedobacter sp. AW1-32]|uniref:RagB/SusD family nutrient uptake outer membrane protein n=1 Tax=Pedobacter sp. AW1-32 TaxID=3383026 RepID=UPI003FF08004
MKNRFFIAISLVLLFTANACKKASFLDPATEPLSEAEVFADSALTNNFLNTVYAATGMDIVPLRNSLVSNSGASDNNGNLEDLTTNNASGFSGQNSFLTGGSSSTSGPFYATYAAYYQKIRAANKLLFYLPTTPLSAAKKTRLAAEARFLRAFYYQALIRLYGSVQLMGDDASDDFPTYEYRRNTYQECVDYIAAEYDIAARDLPSSLEQIATDYGRATSGACYAMKARLLLTAASPLFNGSPVTTDAQIAPLVSYTVSYDQNLWQKAADALKAVIDLPEYALVVDNSLPNYPGNGFWKMFTESRKNSEYIYVFNIAQGKVLENYWFPRSLGTSPYSGATFSNPTEHIVNAFGMNNGKAITDPSSGFSPSSPYLNRDPRFYYSIIYNQALVSDRTTTELKPISIYTNRTTGITTPDGITAYYTKTGFYSRKMCNDRLPLSTLNVDRAYPIIRLAEIYLGYAEALNELGRTEEAVTWLNRIRERAGILPGSDRRYGVSAGISKEALRILLQNEYRVEFYQEGHWFYDTRRWRTAEQTEAQGVTGTRVYLEANGTYTYSSFVHLSTVFIYPQMYFVPFPRTEILKSYGSLHQNPGW